MDIKIQELLRRKKADLSRLEARATELRAEIRGIEQAVQLLELSAEEAAHYPVREPRTTGKRGRGLSEHWKAFLRRLAEEPDRKAHLNMIELICKDVGAPTEPKTVRSQMAQFVKKGILARPSEGNYRLTELGAFKVGIAKAEPPDVGASGGSDDSNGGGVVREQASSTASPEGANPSASTSFRQDLLTGAADLSGPLAAMKGG